MIPQRTLWQHWKRLSALITALMLIIVLPGVDLEAYRSALPESSACTSGVYEVGAFHTSTNYDAGVSGYNQVRTVYTENGSWQTRHVATRQERTELGRIGLDRQARPSAQILRGLCDWGWCGTNSRLAERSAFHVAHLQNHELFRR